MRLESGQRLPVSLALCAIPLPHAWSSPYTLPRQKRQLILQCIHGGIATKLLRIHIILTCGALAGHIWFLSDIILHASWCPGPTIPRQLPPRNWHHLRLLRPLKICAEIAWLSRSDPWLLATGLSFVLFLDLERGFFRQRGTSSFPGCELGEFLWWFLVFLRRGWLERGWIEVWGWAEGLRRPETNSNRASLHTLSTSGALHSTLELFALLLQHFGLQPNL